MLFLFKSYVLTTKYKMNQDNVKYTVDHSTEDCEVKEFVNISYENVDETTQIETTPVETTQIETTQIETTPVETTPVETTPVETTVCGRVSCLATNEFDETHIDSELEPDIDDYLNCLYIVSVDKEPKFAFDSKAKAIKFMEMKAFDIADHCYENDSSIQSVFVIMNDDKESYCVTAHYKFMVVQYETVLHTLNCFSVQKIVF
jgi:hypothetical protein